MYLTGLSIALGVEHDLRSSIPSGGHILCQESCMVMLRISNSSQTKVTDLENKYLDEEENQQLLESQPSDHR